MSSERDRLLGLAGSVTDPATAAAYRALADTVDTEWKTASARDAARHLGEQLPNPERDRLLDLANGVSDQGTADGYRTLAKRRTLACVSPAIVKATILRDGTEDDIVRKVAMADTSKSIDDAPELAIVVATAASPELRAIGTELGVSALRLREAAMARLAEKTKGVSSTTTARGRMLYKSAGTARVGDRARQALQVAAPLLAADRLATGGR